MKNSFSYITLSLYCIQNEEYMNLQIFVLNAWTLVFEHKSTDGDLPPHLPPKPFDNIFAFRQC